MGVQLSHIEEQLRREELEPTELRGNLYELQAKFIQLERAFVRNLQCHRHLEAECNRLRTESEDLRKLDEKGTREITGIATKLARVTAERDQWKNAYLRQKEFIERKKTDHFNTVESVKLECKEILNVTGQTAEKNFRELLELYNAALKKMKILEEEADVLRARRATCENRVLELANLLETLERLDVNVASTCRLAAEALKNLTGKGDSFDESLRELRRLSWTFNNEKNDADQDLLKAQNSVLREIVKKLKRKTSPDSENNVPEKDVERARGFVSKSSQKISDDSVKDNSTCESNLKSQKTRKFIESTCEEAPEVLAEQNMRSHPCALKKSLTAQNTSIDDGAETFSTLAAANESRASEQKPESAAGNSNIRENANVFRVSSHLDGVFFEECVIKFSDNQLMKVKHSPALSANLERLNLEFTDDEDEYQEKRLDGVLIFLKNINAVIKVTRTGLSCATQTARTKVSHDFTQTQTAASQMSRKYAMLNSEKRAIDRSLCKLERTVGILKSSVLGQARDMIGKESKYRGNDEFFECVELLAR